MVLQRDATSPPAIVWGVGKAGQTVYTTFSGRQLTTTVGSDGIWRQALPTTAAGGPYTITFHTDEGDSAALKDVLFGDVYICSGQSNMQFTVTNGFNATQEVAAANNYPNIRLFTVGQGTTSNTPLQNLSTIEQRWSVASNVSVGGAQWGYFSAVCWFFGRDIYDALGGRVPLGLISSNWGGTPIQHWSSPDALSKCGAGKDSTLYNAMIVPFTVGPMSVRGFTWYQGEANVGQTQYYACAMPALVVDWRTQFQAPHAWFGFVQLAAWPDSNGIPIAEMRTAQLAGLSATNVGMATAIDLGDVPGGIHPRNKQTVGQRLAWSALNQVYGQSTPSTYQQYKSGSTSTSGNTITVSIAFRPGGALSLRPATCPTSQGLPAGDCSGYEIQVNDAKQSWIPANATVSTDSRTLILTATTTAGLKATASRYGQSAWPLVTLYDSNGLPVLPWSYPL